MRLSSLARVSFMAEVLGAGLVGGDEGKVDLGLRRQELDFRLFGGFLQPRHGLSLRRSMPCSFLNSSAR